MRSFRQHFAASFFLRHHMLLLILGTVALGVLANIAMRENGVTQLWLRLPLAVVASYLAFFVLVRLWLLYVSARFSPRPSYIETETHIVRGSASEEKRDPWDSSGLEGWVDIPSDEGGCLIVLVGLLLSLVIGGAVLMVFEAPLILTEVALQFFIGVGLVKPLRRIEEPGWQGSVLQVSWKPFLIVLCICATLGGVATLYCPAATTLKAVYSSCLAKS